MSSDFGIKFVPSTPVSEKSDCMFVLGSANGSSMMAAFSVAGRQGATPFTRNLWEKSADGDWLVLKPGDVCHVRLTLTKDHLDIDLSGQSFTVKDGVPYDSFRVELSCLGAKNRWHVLNFALR